MSRNNIRLSIICPMHNEADCLDEFFDRVTAVLSKARGSFEVICINDGSTDQTLERLLDHQRRNPTIRLIDLSRNFGKEAALTCGLDFAQGEAVVPIDADLQNPPELILDMMKRWEEGYEVVLAQRTDRKSDHWLRRKASEWFYWVHNHMSEVSIPTGVGDFRLMDRKVVDALRRLPERQRFMKGLFAWAGFRQTTVFYTCADRINGKSKFSGWRLWNFAIEGLTSFSTVPLRVWTYIGASISILAVVYAVWLTSKAIIFGRDVPGYASLIVSVLLIGGLQLAGLGILGEYIGRIYSEVKHRPIYLVRSVHDAARGLTAPE